jgi:hypothetical protein
LMALAACQTVWYLGAALFLASGRRQQLTAPNRRSRP